MLCTKCSVLKSEKEYYRYRGRPQQPCRICWKLKEKARREDPTVREKRRLQSKERRLLLRTQIIAALGNKCNRCSESDPRVLQVHHVNHTGSSPEEALISSSPKKLLANIISRPEEYELLCANDHVRHHYEVGSDVRELVKPSSPYKPRSVSGRVSRE
jgi:hypothetical protein